MIETASVVLEIPLHPIRILSLTETGTMPDGDGESEVAVEHRYTSPSTFRPVTARNISS